MYVTSSPFRIKYALNKTHIPDGDGVPNGVFNGWLFLQKQKPNPAIYAIVKRQK